MGRAVLTIVTLNMAIFLVGNNSSHAFETPADDVLRGAASKLIRGKVQDETGNPVGGAMIQTVGSDAQAVYRTVSNASGLFLLRVPAEGYYGDSLLVKSSRGELASFLDRYHFTTDRSDPLQIVVRPLRSTVVNVVNSEGVLVAGATVNLIASLQSLATATTDVNGLASIRFPADCKVDWIAAFKDGQGFDYYENYDAFPTTERLEVPQRVELTLDGAMSVQVSVIDSDRNPIADAQVLPWIIHKQGKLSNAHIRGPWKTDADGRIRFDWLPKNLERSISFSTSHAKYHCPKMPYFNPENPEEKELTTVLYRNATIRGRITYADGQPAVGVRLQGEGRGNTNIYFRGYTSTKSDGSYELDIYPDQNTIVAVCNDQLAAPSVTDILLDPGKVLENVDFKLSLGTLVHGTITVGENKDPMIGETATLIQQGDNQAVLVRWNQTDKHGHYQFRIGPGAYTLQLADSEQINLMVTDERELVHDRHLVRPPRGILTGTVVDKDGKPIGGAEVLGESLNARGHAGFNTLTNDRGEFRCERWTDDMILVAYNEVLNVAGIQRVAADDQSVRIVVSLAASVVGQVLDAEKKPLPNCTVFLEISADGDGRCPTRKANTDSDGRFEFAAIPAMGSHRVQVLSLTNPQGLTTKTFQCTAPTRIELEPIVYD